MPITQKPIELLREIMYTSLRDSKIAPQITWGNEYYIMGKAKVAHFRRRHPGAKFRTKEGSFGTREGAARSREGWFGSELLDSDWMTETGHFFVWRSKE